MLVFFALLCLSSITFADDLIVQTTTGTIKGALAPSLYGTSRAFYGIPYAVPPLGDKRFRPSEPVAPWQGILDTTTVKPACIQQKTPPMGMSEDCLTLNVYTPPSISPGEYLPVMFWIHGGSFTSGSGAEFNPAALVPNGVIVVTINYRLGLFGYLQSPLIQKENSTYPTFGGMNGISDQYLALTWFKSNARNFGGDPDSITLFGESAGSLSLCLLVSSPVVQKGSFKRVIFESGSCLGPWGPKDATMGLKQGAQLFDYYNATTLDDLRKIPAQNFLKMPLYGQYTPSLDGVFFPQPPASYYYSLNLNIPDDGAVIVGSNSLDTLFTFPFYFGPFPGSSAEFLEILKNFFGEPDADKVAQIYPTSGPSNPSPKITFSVLNSHLCVVCPTRTLSTVLSQKFPVYMYQFSYNPADGEYRSLSAHFGEVPLVFGFPVFPFPFNLDLSAEMVQYWTSFGKTGIPANPKTGITWPEWTSSHQHIDFNTPISVVNGFHDTQCGFWTEYIGVPVNLTNYLKVAEYCFQVKFSK